MADLMTTIEVPVEKLNTPADLAAFAKAHQLRADWHEPGEQEVGAYHYGSDLDNAMGAGWMPEEPSYGYEGEFNIVLTYQGTEAAVVNLANLLAWAAELGQVKGA